jgi:hypothetical protein
MDNPTTLLVAIMFVTIVVTGLVNTLMCLSDWVTGRQNVAALQASWLVYLLFTFLSYFWNTEMLLEVEGWTFLSFIGFMVGPIVLLFATNMATVVAPEGAEKSELERHYFDFSRRFFLLMFLVQVWLVGLDFSFGMIDLPTYLACLAGLVFFVLMLMQSRKAHFAGAVVIWMALVTQVVRLSLPA